MHKKYLITETDQQVKLLNVTSDRARGSENWLNYQERKINKALCLLLN